jgi:hypothetical protein
MGAKGRGGRGRVGEWRWFCIIKAERGKDQESERARERGGRAEQGKGKGALLSGHRVTKSQADAIEGQGPRRSRQGERSGSPKDKRAAQNGAE